MKRIVVIGAHGLVGSGIFSVLQKSIAADEVPLFEVIGLSRRSTPSLDLTDTHSLAHALPNRFDYLVHAAGVTDELATHQEEATQYAKESCASLYALAVKRGATKLCYISSQHVYGTSEGLITEASITAPRSHYAECHLLSEERTLQCHTQFGVAVQILRPSAVYGNVSNLDAFSRWSLIPFSFPRALVSSGNITLKSSGLQQRSFTSSVRIGGYIKNFLQGGAIREVVNPRGEETLTVLEFAHRTAAIYQGITGKKGSVTVPAESAASSNRPLEPLNYSSSHEVPSETVPLDDFLKQLISRFEQEKNNSKV